MTHPGAGRVLLVGAAGQLGQALTRELVGVREVIGLQRTACDLTDRASVQAAVGGMCPDVIVNCAAYTNVEGAETDPEGARAVNTYGAEHLAEAATGIGAWLLHLSTDYVFDGASRRAYRETDPPHPLNAYGRTKEEGERRVLAACPASLIVRSSWLYGGPVRNFFASMTRLAAEREELKVVRDQVGSPTSVDALAKGLSTLLITHGAKRPTGLLHLAAPDTASWFELAERIVHLMPADRRRPGCRVTPIATSEWPSNVTRPAYSALLSERAWEVYGIALPTWRDQVAEVSARWWA